MEYEARREPWRDGRDGDNRSEPQNHRATELQRSEDPSEIVAAGEFHGASRGQTTASQTQLAGALFVIRYTQTLCL
jgi:hypothetical protein